MYWFFFSFIDIGDLKKGDVGLAALPDRQQEFESKLDLAIKTAKALNCKR